MTIAVLSDIHGVLPALDAVLAEPDVKNAEHIIITGDVAAGPQPTAVLDRLAALGERVSYIRGNADRELADWYPGTTAVFPDEIGPWAAARLTSQQRSWMRSWPTTLTRHVDGLGEVLFCHATPRDDTEMLLVDSRPARYIEVFADLPGTVTTIVCGHTHMPFTRLAANRTVVNPGSVGMPYGPPGAYWALLGPGVTLRRTPLDADAVCAEVIAGSGYAGVEDWTGEYLRGRYSDVDALEVFAPADGRGSAPAA
ncbi:metallophosphoesterase family protein [Phytomonospora endophytica]|uniref:Putative phosphodiesterase n=1 Tax=Phytomonospora endophytica TaxID=714109 RepID=A0A841FMH0_9ACTN|nr:metallophosphoesterase family protein [Phytomonospora endophytica]MBB6033809.1 putative phosphodiesterase [Phytomonospora endophytica]GIG64673.1 phosphoesterase [Phytomonospora endophytica]